MTANITVQLETVQRRLGQGLAARTVRRRDQPHDRHPGRRSLVDDVVDAFVRAACAPFETAGTYNVGTGQHTSPTEVRGLMSAVLDGSMPPSLSEDPSDELHSITLNATRAAKELGWRPTVELADGIRRTMQWLCTTLEPEEPELVGA